MNTYEDPEPMNILGLTFKATDEVGNRIWLRVVADEAYMKHRAKQAAVDILRPSQIDKDLGWHVTHLVELHRDAVQAVAKIIAEELGR
jgi:hypothetical protein